MTAARSRHVATLLLVAITAIWGSTFFLIRDVVLQMPPTDFLAVRFTIAAVAMVAVFWRPMLALNRRELEIGVGLGFLYAVARSCRPSVWCTPRPHGRASSPAPTSC